MLLTFFLGLLTVILVLDCLFLLLLILIFLLTIRRNAIVSDYFMNHVETMICKRDFMGLSALSHRRNECMARISQKTLDFIASVKPAQVVDGEGRELVSVRVEPSRGRQTFMKVGPRNAMVIAVCSLALVADRGRGEVRAGNPLGAARVYPGRAGGRAGPAFVGNPS